MIDVLYWLDHSCLPIIPGVHLVEIKIRLAFRRPSLSYVSISLVFNRYQAIESLAIANRVAHSSGSNHVATRYELLQ